MTRKNSSGPTARQKARQRRMELEKERAALVARIESEQIAFIEATDQIAELHARLDALARTRRDAVGRLVDQEAQPVGDVAVLLGISQTDVRTLRKEYRAALKTTAAPRAVATPTTAVPGPASTSPAGPDEEGAA